MGGAVFYEKVTAARDASFKDTLHAAVSFIKSFLFYRHATSSERSAPTFPSRGRHSSRHFMPFTVLFRDGIASIAKHIKSFCGTQHRGTKPPPGGINGRRRTTSRYNIPSVAINGFKSLNMARDVQPVYKRYPAVRRETDLAIYSHSARPQRNLPPTHHPKTQNNIKEKKIPPLLPTPYTPPSQPTSSAAHPETQSLLAGHTLQYAFCNNP